MRRKAMEYGFWTGQPTIKKAAFLDIDLSIASFGESLEMMEPRVIIGLLEELELHKIMYILGENCVHNVELYSNHRIISSIEDPEDIASIHNLYSLWKVVQFS